MCVSMCFLMCVSMCFQGCYRTRCTPRADAPEYQAFEADEGYALEIQDPVGAWHTCSPSKNISVPGFVGVLTCPAAWGSFCAPPSYDSIRGMRTIPERLMEVLVFDCAFCVFYSRHSYVRDRV